MIKRLTKDRLVDQRKEIFFSVIFRNFMLM